MYQFPTQRRGSRAIAIAKTDERAGARALFAWMLTISMLAAASYALFVYLG